jgi:RsiW-degrading membrane proteinase PrsW (M82 family)
MVRADILASLLPVLLFLAGLLYLDSFKLVRLRHVLLTVTAGCITALVARVAGALILDVLRMESHLFSRYVAPPIEEVVKAAVLVGLFRRNRIGFMVDAAIQGFAVGAGFALVENVYYYLARPEANVYLWIIRGFGTAMMHGGTTAIVAILAKFLLDKSPSRGASAVLPGLALAIILHSGFNHFFLSPAASTALILVVLPVLVVLVFRESEQGTRRWLGIGFDSDRALLEMITTGVLAEISIGRYLQSLQDRFPGEVVADMLCYLRVHLELSVKAKGLLLMREAGFEVPPDAEVQRDFEELRYLEKSIGKTGRIALHPFLHMRTKDLWQIAMLKA